METTRKQHGDYKETTRRQHRDNKKTRKQHLEDNTETTWRRQEGDTVEEHGGHNKGVPQRGTRQGGGNKETTERQHEEE